MGAPTSAERAIEGLRGRFGDALTTSESDRAIHGRDEGSWPTHLPDAVVYPSSTEEVAEAVQICAEHRVPIVAFGAGTSLEGHVIATRGGISIDLSRMNAILEINVDDLDARVQAGVHRMALNEQLGRMGLFFSVDPGADATLGGMAATGAAGTTTVRYGSMRDNVLALRVVLADGTVIDTGTRARKSAAGYDLTRLFIGSEGTLGIITELTVRVYGIPEHIAAAVCSFPTVGDAVATAIEAVQLGIPVARCELLDAVGMRAVNEHAGMDEAEAPTLFLEFHGTEGSVSEDARAVGAIAGAHDGSAFRWATTQEERSRLWSARHNAWFAGLAMRPGCRSLATDAAVPVSRLAECIDQTQADMNALPFPALVIGHVADGNFHVQLLIDGENDGEMAVARAFTARLSARAHAMGGTCTGEHGIGFGKREALVAEAGPAVEVMRALKRALDPEGLLNPDKIFLA